MIFLLQFRGPEILRGAFARGIIQNNSGQGYLRELVKINGFFPTVFMTNYIVEMDKKRIEDEEIYQKNELRRRINIVKEAKGEAYYKSGQFN